MGRKSFIFLVIIALFWIGMIFIVNPIGNFPLNDDFQYARPVQYLVEKGYYYSPDDYSPVIIAQVLWGALFCLPFGFSFTALRISVLVLGLAGIIVFYFLIYRVTKSNLFSFLGSVILLVNPLYFSLSYTFMTEVPFLAFTMLSIYFFSASLESYKPISLILATLFAIIATLIRQFGIVIPVTYAIVHFINNKSKFRKWVIHILPAIFTLTVLYLSLLWLAHTGSPLHPYENHTISSYLNNPVEIARHLFIRTGCILIYSGFFLLPVTLLILRRSFTPLSLKSKWTVLLVSFLFVPLLLYSRHYIPVGNIVNMRGIGPRTVRGIPDGNLLYSHNVVIAIILTGIIGGFVLIMCSLSNIITVFSSSPNGSNSGFTRQFVLVCMICYSILLFIPDFFFDRYMILFIPLFLVLIIPNNLEFSFPNNLTRLVLYAIFIIPIAYFSVTATHDYLAWNRARWEALEYMGKDCHISNHKIDGGYEYNGWYFTKQYSLLHGKHLWYVDDDEYVIEFNNLPGYKIIKQFPYQNYFPYEERTICILHESEY